MGLALLAVGILSGVKAYMQSVGKTALQAILGAGTSEVVKELLTLVLRKDGKDNGNPAILFVNILDR